MPGIGIGDVVYDDLATQPEDQRVANLQNPDGSWTSYVRDGESWLTVPYGQDPIAYANAPPDQRVEMELIGEAEYTRDSNRSAVLGAGETILGNQGAAGQALADSNAARLEQQDTARQQAAGIDLGALTDASGYQQDAATSDQDTVGQLAQLTGGAGVADQGALQGFDTARQGTDARSTDYLSALIGESEDNRGADQTALEGLRGSIDAAGQADQAAFDPLRNLAFNEGADDPYPEWGSDLTSAAGAARADESDVGTQRGVLDALLGQAGFTVSDGTTLESSPYAGLVSREAQAEADPYSVESQRFFLDQYRDNSDAAITPAERFMMETARLGEEQSRSAAMGAQMRNLRERGVGGSGAEVGAMLGAQQTTSQNRMLQDMAALASATERAERNRGAGSQLATGIRNQSFGEELDTGRAYDNMQLQNRDFGRSALLAAGDLSTTRRNQGFNEGYQTGTSTDQMERFNREGSLAQANQNAERQRQEYDAAVRRQMAITGMDTDLNAANYGREQDAYGAARDVAGDQFGRASQLYSAADTANQAAYGRAGDVYDATRATTGAAYDRGSALANTQLDAAQQAYLRGMTTTGLQTDLNAANYGRDMDYLGSLAGSADAAYNVNRDTAGNVLDLTNLYTGGQARDSGAAQDALRTAAGGYSSRAALEALEDEGGFLGNLPLIGPSFRSVGL